MIGVAVYKESNSLISLSDLFKIKRCTASHRAWDGNSDVIIPATLWYLFLGFQGLFQSVSVFSGVPLILISHSIL